MIRNFGAATAAILFLSLSAQVQAGSTGISVVFSSDEAATIRAWYREEARTGGGAKVRGKGPGKGLPPGIARNLRAGKPLPPGIAKRSLAPDLIGRLPPPPKGFERIEVAGKILLIEIATQVIHDVLEDLLFD